MRQILSRSFSFDITQHIESETGNRPVSRGADNESWRDSKTPVGICVPGNTHFWGVEAATHP